MEIAEFLLARIAEDARLALGVMSAEDDASAGAAAPYGYGDAAVLSEAEKAHMVRWDPARVLAECDAKRRIVEEHPARYPYSPTPECERCEHFGESVDWPCLTLRVLARLYADHPDYREEWKP